MCRPHGISPDRDRQRRLDLLRGAAQSISNRAERVVDVVGDGLHAGDGTKRNESADERVFDQILTGFVLMETGHDHAKSHGGSPWEMEQCGYSDVKFFESEPDRFKHNRASALRKRQRTCPLAWGVKVTMSYARGVRPVGSIPLPYRLSCRYNYQSLRSVSITFGNFRKRYQTFVKQKYSESNSTPVFW
jgi:hypothetical protein